MHISCLIPAACIDLYQNIHALKTAKKESTDQAQIEVLARRVFVTGRDCLAGAFLAASPLFLPIHAYMAVTILTFVSNLPLVFATHNIQANFLAVAFVIGGIVNQEFSYIGLGFAFLGVAQVAGSVYRRLIVYYEQNGSRTSSPLPFFYNAKPIVDKIIKLT